MPNERKVETASLAWFSSTSTCAASRRATSAGSAGASRTVPYVERAVVQAVVNAGFHVEQDGTVLEFGNDDFWILHNRRHGPSFALRSLHGLACSEVCIQSRT